MHKELSIFAVLACAGTATAQPEPTAAPATDPATDPAAPPAEDVSTTEAKSSEPAPADKKEDAVAGYDKGFFLRSPDGRYSLKISGRVQPFYTLNIDNKSEPTDYKSALEVRRARLTLEGNIHSKSLAYKFQTDFGKGSPSLKDYYFDAEFAKNTWLRVGQWKRPFSRQQITSSGKLEITDRSITDKAFIGSRDIGVAIHNNYEKSPEFEWVIGVFNGTGDGAKFTPTFDGMGNVNGGGFSNVPVKLKPTAVARAGYNHNGIKGYSEADLEGGPLRFAVAANVQVEGDNDDDDASNQKAGIDYVVKVDGFSTTGGGYAMTQQDDLKLSDQELKLLGFHVQAGYMATDKLQLVGRYALVDDRTDDTKRLQEISVGGNFYGLGAKIGHDAKLAAAVRFNKIGDAGFEDGVLIEIGANVGF